MARSRSSPAVEDQANPSKWLPGMTADGVHPTSAGHLAAAGIVAPIVDAWTAT